MDPFALFFSTVGRLSQKQFWLSLLVVYLASLASQFLLAGTVTARAGFGPFAVTQLAVLWAWTVLHIKRLRDAGRSPAGAIAVALLYGLAVGLIFLIVVAINTGGAPVPEGEKPSGHSLLAAWFLVGFLVFLFDPNLGPFTMIIKALVLIACLPFVLSLAFSLYTGLRRSVP
jgi:uncharacterized membrane protein YhaH (DUF805 family)